MGVNTVRENSIIPAELVRDIPYITMSGSSSLQIEHHHGMVSYQPEKAAFDTGCGLLTITGSDLVVSRYTSSEAGLTGHICTVQLDAKGDD